jgi:ABC-type nitrate/sulfonate/bicarbonate transport system substrate-binding protein
MSSTPEPLAFGGPRSRRDFLRTVASGVALGSLAPLASACGSDESGAKRGVVRFAFAPDPVWDYMNDNNMILRWEEEHNQRIVTSSTWDEFAYFAGGHGDLVSTATYELPLLEQETKIKTVTFGKYNLLRITPLAKPEKNYKTLADIPKGSKIAVPSAVSSTLVWGMFAKKLHDLDFRVGRGDFNLVVEDHFVMAEHVLRDQVEAALAIPEAAIAQLRKGELEVMYDGRLPWEVYSEIVGEEHKGVMGNNFTSTKKWYDANKEEAAAFVRLWEDGIKAWRDNQAKIIQTYPQHFAVEEEADIKAMQDYLAEHDWFVDSVVLDDAWIKKETRLYELMKETGFMPKDAPVPAFTPVEAPA